MLFSLGLLCERAFAGIASGVCSCYYVQVLVNLALRKHPHHARTGSPIAPASRQ